MQLVLASASPRRKEILEGIGLAPRVIVAAVDEASRPGETPEGYAARVAAAKAAHVARRLAEGEPGAQALVLGADTIVVTAAGEVLGKARDVADARRMLEALSGRAHAVLTAFSLWHVQSGAASEVESGIGRTSVDVRPLRASELEGYLSTGEWGDKAGAYAVQGVFGAFVRALDGAYANVVGLPVYEVVEALWRAGFFTGRAFPAAVPPPASAPGGA